MIQRFAICAAALLAANAASAAIFPSMVGGEYQVKCRQPEVTLDADGIPTVLQGRSCAIVETGLDPLDPVNRIACLSTPDVLIPYPITFKVVATGQRKDFKGYAFDTSDCSGGNVSDPSAETVYTYPGMSPRPVEVQP